MALGEGAQQHVGALAARRGAPGVLLRVHALIGDQQSLLAAGRLAGDGDGAVGGGDGESVAMLGQRGGRRELDLRAGAGVGEHAELVAPETIGPAMGPDAALECLAQAREQRVAGEVAEGVVVVLEAIEVEEQQHRRVGGPGGGGLEVGHELAAVGQPRQAVARRGDLQLAARCAQRQRRERHEHQGHGQDGEWPRPDVA